MEGLCTKSRLVLFKIPRHDTIRKIYSGWVKIFNLSVNLKPARVNFIWNILFVGSGPVAQSDK